MPSKQEGLDEAELDERFLPAVEMIGRTGAKSFTIRWCEEEDPPIWMALASYEQPRKTIHHEVAAALDPVQAVFRLCDQLIDGGQCLHCQRPTGFSPDFDPMPMDEVFCWYQFDPELKTFRRSCEAEFPKKKEERRKR